MRATRSAGWRCRYLTDQNEVNTGGKTDFMLSKDVSGKRLQVGLPSQPVASRIRVRHYPLSPDPHRPLHTLSCRAQPLHVVCLSACRKHALTPPPPPTPLPLPPRCLSCLDYCSLPRLARYVKLSGAAGTPRRRVRRLLLQHNGRWKHGLLLPARVDACRTPCRRRRRRLPSHKRPDGALHALRLHRCRGGARL